MHTEAFRQLLGLLETLDAEQRAQLQLQLIVAGGIRSVTAIIERDVAQRPCCPRCGESRVVRNGHADGLQHYKCRACDRTFNALTETPLARLRHREKWLAQASVLDGGLSVRRAAVQMRMHRTRAETNVPVARCSWSIGVQRIASSRGSRRRGCGPACGRKRVTVSCLRCAGGSPCHRTRAIEESRSKSAPPGRKTAPTTSMNDFSSHILAGSLGLFAADPCGSVP